MLEFENETYVEYCTSKEKVIYEIVMEYLYLYSDLLGGVTDISIHSRVVQGYGSKPTIYSFVLNVHLRFGHKLHVNCQAIDENWVKRVPKIHRRIENILIPQLIKYSAK